MHIKTMRILPDLGEANREAPQMNMIKTVKHYEIMKIYETMISKRCYMLIWFS